MPEHAQLHIGELVIGEIYELHLKNTYDGSTAAILAELDEVLPDMAVFYLDGDEKLYDAVLHFGGRVQVEISDIGNVVRRYAAEKEDQRRERYLDQIASGSSLLHGSPLLVILDRRYWGRGEITPGPGWVLAVFERMALVDEARLFGWPMVGEPTTGARTTTGQQVGAVVRPLEGPFAARRCFSFADHDELRIANNFLLQEIREGRAQIRLIQEVMARGGPPDTAGSWFNYRS